MHDIAVEILPYYPSIIKNFVLKYPDLKARRDDSRLDPLVPAALDEYLLGYVTKLIKLHGEGCV